MPRLPCCPSGIPLLPLGFVLKREWYFVVCRSVLEAWFYDLIAMWPWSAYLIFLLVFPLIRSMLLNWQVFSEIMDLKSTSPRVWLVEGTWWMCFLSIILQNQIQAQVRKSVSTARQRKPFGKGEMRFHGCSHAKGSDYTKNGITLSLCTNTP